MKVRSVTPNNRRNEFAVVARSGAIYTFPCTVVDPQPGSDDRVFCRGTHGRKD